MNNTETLQFGLNKKQLDLILDAINSYNEIEKVLIFGSRARGTNEPGSDIDLALIGPKLSRLLINRFASILDDLPLPFFFDIVDYNEIKNDLFKNKIKEEGKLLFERRLNTV